jgi:DNA segregation ATPase FtsK/SpoIIIE, S-DNA-T family
MGYTFSKMIQNKKTTHANLFNISQESKPFIKESIAIFVVFLTLFVMLSIFSYSPEDASFFTTKMIPLSEPFGTVESLGDKKINNLFGAAGAEIAAWTIELAGLGAYFFSTVFLAHSLFILFKRKKIIWKIKILGYFFLVVFFLAFLNFISPTFSFKRFELFTGGLIGFTFSEKIKYFLGFSGAIIFCIFGILASLPIAFGVEISKIAQFIFVHGRKKTIPSTKISQEKILSEVLIPSIKFEKKYTETQIIEPKIQVRATQNSATVSQQTFHELLGILSNSPHLEKNIQEKIKEQLFKEAKEIEEKLENFGIKGKVLLSQPGPVVNTHEYEPAPGIKVSKIVSLQDDLALGLKAQNVSIAPQPGKSTLGIEIPSQYRLTIGIKEIIETFSEKNYTLPIALGKKTDGSALVADLASMPHLLIAGSTGSGKSVGINSLLISLILSRTPSQLRLILVDPKMLELSNYNNLGHLLMPVVTEPSKAAGALKWAILEMDKRYETLKQAGVRNIAGYNEKPENALTPLPYIVIVIDELCDLMMTSPKDVEDSIQRLAQKARAAGIHLVLATQRPSVDVITGVIKANLPCRISFQVASRHDSRTIIESIGAERLLGRGDMIFLPPGVSKHIRAHGAYISDTEINAISDAVKKLYPTQYANQVISEVEKAIQTSEHTVTQPAKISNAVKAASEEDLSLNEEALYQKSLILAKETGFVSTSSVQRNFRIGYNRAARLIERMEAEGLIGPPEVAGKPRPLIVKIET